MAKAASQPFHRGAVSFQPSQLHSSHVQVYHLSYGIETMQPLSGTAEELFALLDAYALTVVFDVLIFEKLAGGEFFKPLRRYAAERAISEMEGV